MLNHEKGIEICYKDIDEFFKFNDLEKFNL